MSDSNKLDPNHHAIEEDKTPVTISASQYRSMVLSKLRSDIAAKKAAYDAAAKANIHDLSGMSYWKMQYWKMKYWKMGGIENPGDVVINPVSEKIK